MTTDELASAVGREAANELSSGLAKIKHCGNVRQWIVAGLGGAADGRDRPAEFAECGPIPRVELLRRLEAVVDEARAVLARQTARQLLEARRIQGFDVTGLAAIFDSVPHFRGHTQEIVSMTRLQLGDAYKFAWAPTTPEQGASS